MFAIPKNANYVILESDKEQAELNETARVCASMLEAELYLGSIFELSYKPYTQRTHASFMCMNVRTNFLRGDKCVDQ